MREIIPTFTSIDEVPDGCKYAFVIGEEGHFSVKTNGIFESVTRCSENPKYAKISEYLRIRCEKIPQIVIAKSLKFLSLVYEKYKSEGFVLLTHDEEVGWGLNIPNQTVSPAHVDYENTDNVRAVGDIHSHPGFSNNPSGTDVNDEKKFDGIHIIVSGWSIVEDNFNVIATSNGSRFRVSPCDIIEGLEHTDVEIPNEWMDKVKSRVSRGVPMGNRDSYYGSGFEIKNKTLGKSNRRERVDRLTRGKKKDTESFLWTDEIEEFDGCNHGWSGYEEKDIPF